MKTPSSEISKARKYQADYKNQEKLNKKRSKLNNENCIFAEVRLISGGCQYTYQREGG